METEGSPGAQKLGAEERLRLRRAHERLRTASKDLEVLIATEPIKNRWEPEAAPAEILDVARADLRRAYADIVSIHEEILGWEMSPEAG